MSGISLVFASVWSCFATDFPERGRVSRPIYPNAVVFHDRFLGTRSCFTTDERERGGDPRPLRKISLGPASQHPSGPVQRLPGEAEAILSKRRCLRCLGPDRACQAVRPSYNGPNYPSIPQIRGDLSFALTPAKEGFAQRCWAKARAITLRERAIS